jgi:hypothetical protein
MGANAGNKSPVLCAFCAFVFEIKVNKGNWVFADFAFQNANRHKMPRE